jgi:hypothetical protein
VSNPCHKIVSNTVTHLQEAMLYSTLHECTVSVPFVGGKPIARTKTGQGTVSLTYKK